MLEVPKGDAKFFLSDAVSCKANLAQLTDPEAQELFKGVISTLTEVLGKGFRRKKLSNWRSSEPEKWFDVIAEFNKLPTTKRLVQFIREEKPYFQGIVDPIDLLKPDVVFPKKSNSRIAAQSGAFLAFGLNKSFSDASIVRQNIKKTVIDIGSDQKSEILRALSAIGVSESFVYPEFERAAEQIKKAFS